MTPTPHPSPNFGLRPPGARVDMVVLHYTGMETGQAALDRLCERAAEVSAHYLVEEDGRVFALVPEDARAWHAGASHWGGRDDVNNRSIGIEIVNPGHEWGYRDFPEAQIAALEDLLAGIAGRHAIPPAHYLAHSDVAPTRKQDPGERFPWLRLARRGFGVWPEGAQGSPEPLRSEGKIAEYQWGLACFGYKIDVNGRLDDETRAVTVAFQRHFEPEIIGTAGQGVPAGSSLARALALAELCS